MNKLFVAAFIIVMILLLSSVFVHISTDLIVSETVVNHGRVTYIPGQQHDYR
ncbi:MAG: hypothetical protein WBD99_03155 [Thermodesulfobacteriota bacterium]